MLSPCLLRGRLFCRLAVRRQRLFELLFDTEGVGGGARPEFPQDMGLRSRQVALDCFGRREALAGSDALRRAGLRIQFLGAASSAGVQEFGAAA
jgi:hypothetical protein